jgi:hypothetical protein
MSEDGGSRDRVRSRGRGREGGRGVEHSGCMGRASRDGSDYDGGRRSSILSSSQLSRTLSHQTE